MRRRRTGRWSNGDSFGASLADILTTALGCVLLLFLIAVLSARIALTKEQSAHTETTMRLRAEAAERKLAEMQRATVIGQKSAVETALEQQLAAKGDMERALRASEDARKALEQELAGAQAQAESLASQLGQAEAAKSWVDSKFNRLLDVAGAAAKPQGTASLPIVDLLLVIDATASMAPSLDATRRQLQALITALGVVSSEPRVGVAVFRDAREDEGFRVEALPPTGQIDRLSDFLAGIRASSTRVDDDLPEWMAGGMKAAASMPQRPDAVRLMVVVSDAADQAVPGSDSAEQWAARFRADGGQVYVVSTVPASAEKKAEIAEDYSKNVLAEHERIAAVGGGAHIAQAGSDQLVQEVLRAVLRARDERRDTESIDHLRDTLQQLQTEPAPDPVPAPVPAPGPP